MITTNQKDFIINNKPVRLAGNHTWNTVQAFNNNTASLKQIVGNFTRLWAIEPQKVDTTFAPQWRVENGSVFNISPTLFKRNNGKYDLTRVNKNYLVRLEKVVKRAEKRDIVTGVVLFDGAWNRFFGPTSWNTHPFNPKNNIQQIGPSNVQLVHSKGEWNVYQKNYVREVIKTLEPYKNVIFEIGNELDRSSIKWQKQKVKFIDKLTEKPVGVSYVTRTPNTWMETSRADFFVPSSDSKGGSINVRGPIIFDTDHGWPLRSNVSGLSYYWNQGRNLWLMDGMNEGILRNIDDLQPDRNFINGVLA
jgi:hypothetical protein